MVAPRKAKELTNLMLQDQRLVQDFYNLVHDADKLIEKRMLAATSRWLRDRDVDLDLMSHDEVGEAMRKFYRKARVSGRYVRLW